MEESGNYSRFLNPCLLHLQKMGLELKCPMCLNLLSHPILLPCDHIFCSPCISRSTNFRLDCPVCKISFLLQDLRPAPYVENMVSIYKSMDAAFGSNHRSDSRVDLSDTKRPSDNIDVGEKSRVKPMESIHRESSKEVQSSNPCFPDCKRVQASLCCTKSGGKCERIETRERDVNHLAQTSSYGPPSFGGKKDSDNDSNDQISKSSSATGLSKNKSEDGTTPKIDLLSPSPYKDPSRSETKLAGKLDTMNRRPISQGTEDNNSYSKRQKKLNYGICDHVIESGLHDQSINLDNENSTKDVSASNSESDIKTEGLLCSKQPSASNHLESNPAAVCAFCQIYIDSMASGPMLHYVNGKAVTGDKANESNILHVHRKCMEWTPRVYFDDEIVKNLDLEVARGAKIKCKRCGKKGATLGCYSKSCRRSYHVPCAVNIPECKWDSDNFFMLCPVHASLKFPNEKSETKKIGANHSSEIKLSYSKSAERLLSSTTQKANVLWLCSPDDVGERVLCGSALSVAEEDLVADFARLTKATITKVWSKSVTHVIASTNEAGACIRTIKVLMGILNGKWILKIEWIKACMEAMRHVDEEPFEISRDIYGCCDGPKTGRMRIMEKEPKLFSGVSFYFSGDFVPSYKGYLEDLIIAAGGTVHYKREQLTSEDDSNSTEAPSKSFVIYSLDPPERCNSEQISSALEDRLNEAKAFASETGSHVIGHIWILDSIAACRLQPLPYPFR